MNETAATTLTDRNTHSILTYFIAAVWLANGLLCKVLNLVPRHEHIVGRILGEDFSRPLTVIIGLSEIVMAAWVVSNYQSRLNVMVQMILVALMNSIEFVLVPDLLLWGKWNAAFAFLFIGLVYYNEFVLNTKIKLQTIQ